MENNLIPTFIMREAGLLVNDVARIYCGEDVSHKSHYIIVQEEDVDIHIKLRLDRIFSYSPTQSLTPEEIENIDYVEAIFFTPDSTSWDPYVERYEDEEDNFIDQKGDIIYPQKHKRKLFNDQYVFDITIPAEQYYEATDQALDDKDIEDSYSNTQEVDANFNRKEDPIQVSIADMTAYFYGNFLKIVVNERTMSD